jgi:hypothetical protein
MMPRISLVLDRADRTYPPGAPVGGTVEVDLSDEWPDARLVLTRQWRATGHAETDTGDAVDVVVFEGTRPPGRTSHPIAFDAPWGPLTHHGTILRVGWFLTARLEGQGPTLVAEEELHLVGPADAAHSASVSLGPEFGEEDWADHVVGLFEDLTDRDLAPLARRLAAARQVGILRLLGGLAVLMVGLRWLWTALAGGWARADIFFAAFAGATAAAGAWLTAWALLPLATSWLAGPFGARLDRAEVRRQERITCAVRLPRRFLEAREAVTATLEATERTRRRAGDRRRDGARRHTARVERAPAARIGKIEREAGELLLTITVPADAPPTFASAHNSLAWSVTVHVRPGRWPAWERRFPLTVRP